MARVDAFDDYRHYADQKSVIQQMIYYHKIAIF